MGNKGDKNTGAAQKAASALVAELSSITGITSKNMFGGCGIFHESTMFGIIDSTGTPFLKINDDFKSDFEGRGAQKHSRMPYYSIPDEILDNNEMLINWAKRSIEISK